MSIFSWFLPDGSVGPIESVSGTPTAAELAPIDFLLDQEDDIIFDKGDIVFSRGLAAVVQNVMLNLSQAKGQWFLDLEEGAPWFDNDVVPEAQAILGQTFDEQKIRDAIRIVILKTVGIQSLISIAASFDTASRKTFISFNAKSIFGETGTVTVVV